MTLKYSDEKSIYASINYSKKLLKVFLSSKIRPKKRKKKKKKKIKISKESLNLKKY